MDARGGTVSENRQAAMRGARPGGEPFSELCRKVVLLITEDWTQDDHEAFLRLIRAHWRGWNLVVFEDRASQHKGARAWAREELKIETRLLPKASPELNPMDHLWRHTKRATLGDRATLSIEASALAACQYLIDLSPHDRLQKAGVLSGHFWLTL